MVVCWREEAGAGLVTLFLLLIGLLTGLHEQGPGAKKP